MFQYSSEKIRGEIMALPALIAAGLSLLPKLPEMWGEVAKLFNKKVPKGVEEASKLADTIMDELGKGKVPPEIQLRLKELFYAHQEKILELQLKDVQNAREREVRIVEATGEKDHFLYFLAMLVVTGFFALCGLLMWRPLPQGSIQAVYLLFGGLVSGFGAVLQYFFGSSKSSREKTKLLAKTNLTPPL